MMMWFQEREAERILQGRDTANEKEHDLEASFDTELLKCKSRKPQTSVGLWREETGQRP